MRIGRSDLAGAACALLALGLVAWLALDSWAIARCKELAASGAAAGGETPLSPEQAACR